jgi:hypothetical protein
MTLTTATYDTNTEQDAKAKPVAEHNLNSQISAKKALLGFTGYLILAAAIFPLMFTTGCLASIILSGLATIIMAG